MRTLTHDDYQVGWICALHEETAAAIEMLDEEHASLPNPRGDPNTYTFGRIGDHNVVIAGLPAGQIGTTPAASVAAHMVRTFLSMRFGLLVGIAGGVPSTNKDVRLGDVVVSKPSAGKGGVVQYDYGIAVRDGELEPSGFLNAPPSILGTAVHKLMAQHEKQPFAQYFDEVHPLMGPSFAYPGAKHDLLFEDGYKHIKGDKHVKGETSCDLCDPSKVIQRENREQPGPRVCYGNIGSGNQVVQDPATRNRMAERSKLLCFEMEAAGVNEFPCVVIRGISDYSDSHKNKLWKSYASATSAACAKQLLSLIKIEEVTMTAPISPAPLTCFMFAKQLFPMESVSLGRLVVSMREPWLDFCAHTPKIAKDILTTTEPRMHDILRRCEGSHVYNRLNNLFSSYSGLPLDYLHTAPEKTYVLLNPASYFRELCSENAVKSWFEVALKYAWNT